MAKRKATPKVDPPWSDFPLQQYANGQWGKKIKGTRHHFGVIADPVTAHARYEALMKFGDKNHVAKDATVELAISEFMASKERKLKRGAISADTMANHIAAGQRLEDFLGASFPLGKLGPKALNEFRDSWPNDWSPLTVRDACVRTLAIIRYANKTIAAKDPVDTGEAFETPTEREVLIARANAPTRYFNAREIKKLVKASDSQMRAMILLGLNCGFGNADIGRLEWSQIDLNLQWYRSPRGKTGQWREAWLWPETVDAIQASGERHDQLVFLTKYGRPWWVDGDGRRPLSQEFRKLAKDVGVYRKGVGHYALRHVFLTVADELGDTTAMRIVLGQKDPTISQSYRERIDPKRIKRVCSHVRKWYKRNSKKPKK